MKNPDREDADELAEAAAKCLVEKAKAQFEKQGVDLDAPTRNVYLFEITSVFRSSRGQHDDLVVRYT